MRLSPHFAPLLLAVTLSLASGCAGPTAPPLQRAWVAPVHSNAGPGTTAQPSDSKDRIAVVGQFGDYVDVIDAETGKPVSQTGETKIRWQEFVTMSSKLGGGVVASFERDELTFASAGQDVVLLFDPSQDEIRALDLRTTEPLWVTRGYPYSLEKYKAFLGGGNVGGVKVQTGLGSMLSGVTGGFAEQFLLPEARGFRVAKPLPDSDIVLVASTKGLVGLEARTGEERFRIPDFEGMGIAHVGRVDGDVVAVSFSYLKKGMTVRFDPETGALRWRKAKAGIPFHGSVEQEDGVLFLDNRRSERSSLSRGRTLALDLSTGDFVYEVKSKAGIEEKLMSGAIQLGDGYYRVRTTMPVVGLGKASLIRYAPDGSERWRTDEVKMEALDVLATEDVVVRVGQGGDLKGLVLIGHDPEDGRELWRTSAVDKDPRLLRRRGDRVCGASGRSLFCVDLSNGKFIYRHDLPGDVNDAVMWDGRVVAAAKGALAVVEPDGRLDLRPKVLPKKLTGLSRVGPHVIAYHTVETEKYQPVKPPRGTDLKTGVYELPSVLRVYAIRPGDGSGVLGYADLPVRYRHAWHAELIKGARVKDAAFETDLDTGFLVTDDAIFAMEPGRLVRYRLSPTRRPQPKRP